MTENLDKPQILVIKHGALGDIMQGLDAFASLRAGNPDAHIALMTSPAFAGLTAMMPWFDEIIIDPRAGVFNIAAGWRNRTHLRRRWAVIVDMQCSHRTARYFSVFVRRETRWIGTVAGCSDLLPDFTGVNNQQRMLITAKRAGGNTDADTADINWLAGDDTSLAAIARLNLPASYAVLVPGCSQAKPEKRWPAAQFAALARALNATGLAVCVVGTSEDRDAVDAMLVDAPKTIDLCGKTNLSVLATLCSGAACVIGNDTGPMFLAARSGAPSLVLMGPQTNPDMSAPTGPAARWLRAISIDDISVADVELELKRLRQV